MRHLLMVGGLALAMSPACAASPLLSGGPALSAAQEAADAETALAFRRDAVAAGRTLAADFRNHDVQQPSGGSNYARYIAAPDARDADAAAATAALLFVITDGDLTMAASAGADPAAGFASSLIEVKHGRVMQRWYSGTAMPAGTTPPAGAATVPMVPANTADRATRDAAKTLVQAFFADFFVKGDQAAAQALAPDLLSHVAGVPSGPGFALVARKHQDKVTAPDVSSVLFVLVQGDLVAIGFPVPYAGDPGARYAQNVVRVKDGRIVDWWFSGTPAGHPGAPWRP